MIRVAIVCMALVTFASTTWGNDACPPAGSTPFDDSEGCGEIQIPGLPDLRPFFTCGPTTIVRGDPVGSPQCTIETEIVAMSLTGVFDPCGVNRPISIDLAPSPPSAGEIVSDPMGHFPASSFFDVYTTVTLTDTGESFSHFAHVEEPMLDAIPPGSATPGGPPCVQPGDDVYAQGFPAHAHDPCPPKQCCQLPCGRRVHVSPRCCQRFGGFPVGPPCEPLCATQTPVEFRSWGTIKHTYMD